MMGLFCQVLRIRSQVWDVDLTEEQVSQPCVLCSQSENDCIQDENIVPFQYGLHEIVAKT